MSFNVIAATSVITALVLLQVCDVSGRKGKVGENCSNSGPSCESGLMCVNKFDVAVPDVEGQDDFTGKCQKVDMCQLQSAYLMASENFPLIVERPIVADEEAGIAD